MYKLDSVITVVDAKHIIPRLDEKKPEGVENEAVEQVVFADRVSYFILRCLIIFLRVHKFSPCTTFEHVYH